MRSVRIFVAQSQKPVFVIALALVAICLIAIGGRTSAIGQEANVSGEGEVLFADVELSIAIARAWAHVDSLASCDLNPKGHGVSVEMTTSRFEILFSPIMVSGDPRRSNLPPGCHVEYVQVSCLRAEDDECSIDHLTAIWGREAQPEAVN